MDLIELPAAELPVDIPRMAAAVGAMVRRALESFVEGKAELAQAVLGGITWWTGCATRLLSCSCER